MNLFTLCILICFYFLVINVNYGYSHCVLTKDPYSNQPIIFDKLGNIMPISQIHTKDQRLQNVVTFNVNETLVLSCAPKFYRDSQSKQIVYAKCVSPELIEFDDGINIEENQNHEQRKKFSDFRCEENASLQRNHEIKGCGDGKIGAQFGYLNPVLNFSFIMAEECFNKHQQIFKRMTYSSKSLNIVPLTIIQGDQYFDTNVPVLRHILKRIEYPSIYIKTNGVDYGLNSMWIYVGNNFTRAYHNFYRIQSMLNSDQTIGVNLNLNKDDNNDDDDKPFELYEGNIGKNIYWTVRVDEQDTIALVKILHTDSVYRLNDLCGKFDTIDGELVCDYRSIKWSGLLKDFKDYF